MKQGNPHDGVAPGVLAYLGDHAGKLHRMVARLGAGAQIFNAARDAIVEQSTVGQGTLQSGDMRDAVHKSLAQQLRGDPAHQSA